jgi:hypothetical protein
MFRSADCLAEWRRNSIEIPTEGPELSLPLFSMRLRRLVGLTKYETHEDGRCALVVRLQITGPMKIWKIYKAREAACEHEDTLISSHPLSAP